MHIPGCCLPTMASCRQQVEGLGVQLGGERGMGRAGCLGGGPCGQGGQRHLCPCSSEPEVTSWLSLGGTRLPANAAWHLGENAKMPANHPRLLPPWSCRSPPSTHCPLGLRVSLSWSLSCPSHRHIRGLPCLWRGTKQPAPLAHPFSLPSDPVLPPCSASPPPPTPGSAGLPGSSWAEHWPCQTP